MAVTLWPISWGTNPPKSGKGELPSLPRPWKSSTPILSATPTPQVRKFLHVDSRKQFGCYLRAYLAWIQYCSFQGHGASKELITMLITSLNQRTMSNLGQKRWINWIHCIRIWIRELLPNKGFQIYPNSLLRYLEEGICDRIIVLLGPLAGGRVWL